MTASSHFVIGTAGHIDHGKTTLVKALTGVDTDRWAEEKRRGITIDLGFAPYQDEAGNQFSFVDVPGHERFVHNMLAGAAGMDGVMLVVAADEGVMPQTLEHLQICQLLGISQGLVALTRVDLVEDEELVDLCAEEIRELCQHTFLQNAPVIPISAKTGQGIEHLQQSLTQLLGSLHPKNIQAPFRYAVDRSFSLKGFGTVVTGTVLSGRLAQDQPVWQFPQHRPVKIRGLQVHGQSVAEIQAGQRAAINLAQLSKEEIQRGDQLAQPESLLNSYLLNVKVELSQHASQAIQNRQRFRIHHHTSEVMGRLVLLEGEELLPGQSQWAQLRLESPLASKFADRFILRNYSPVLTVGGGKIVDPAPIKSRRLKPELKQHLEIILNGPEVERLNSLVLLQGLQGVDATGLLVRSGLGRKQIDKCMQKLTSEKKVLQLDAPSKLYVHTRHLWQLGQFVIRLLNLHHQKFPDRQGMTKAELAGKLNLLFSKESVIESILKYLLQQQLFAFHDGFYCHNDHKITEDSSTTELMNQCLVVFKSAEFQPPRLVPLAEQLQIDPKNLATVIKQLGHQKIIVPVATDLYYLKETLQAIELNLREYFESEEKLSVIDFKSRLGIGRKHAVDLLEWFDRQGITLRKEEYRILRHTESTGQHSQEAMP